MQTSELLQSQELTLKKFRERIKDCVLSDSSDEHLKKWLVARNYDLDESEKMLRQSLEWRRVNKIDQILEVYQPPKLFNEYYSLDHVGSDKFGCPIWYSSEGRIDFIGIFRATTKKELARYYLWIVEEMARVIREESGNKKVTKQTVIFDMEGLSLRQIAYKPAMDVGMESLRIFEANYPESLRRAFVINAPKIFAVLYNLVKPCLHQATVDKIRIFGSNKDEWSKAMLEEIDADQLPVHYGGTRTDPNGDPRCPSKFKVAREIPRELYLSNTPPIPKDGMESLTVIAGAGGKKKIKFKVEKIDSVLKWEFMTEGGDIAYRVYWKSSDGDVFDLVPFDRVDSHLIMEEGHLNCEQTGKYVMEFDNTFSYLRPKKVRYLITIESASAKK